MSKLFFIADQHYFHENIIKYCNRPFVNADEMNTTMVANHNQTVSNKDTVYMLGDVFFKNKYIQDKDIYNLLKSLNGNKILITGNHDNINYIKNLNIFSSIHEYLKIKVNNQKIILFHYPIYSWDCSFHGSIHLYGHVHGTIDNPTKNSLDVGVDNHNYYPLSLEEVHAKIEAKNAKIVLKSTPSI